MRYLFPVFFLFSIFYFLFSIPISAATLTVCQQAGPGCTFTQGAGLQEAVDMAKNDDTIVINGELSGAIFQPFDGRMNVTYCFVDLKGKDLTLKGGKLFGDGHNIGRTVEPPGDENSRYFHRAAICSKGGKITIEGMNIDEFEGGGMQFWDAQIILKNNIIQGHDHGAVFLFNSSVLAVNNNFISNIGFIPFGKSIIRAYNNTFYNSKAIVAAVSCNDDIPDLEFINNIVVDEELTLGIGGLTTSCPEKVSQFKERKIEYNLLWKRGRNWYPHEYQDNFPGKIVADPLFKEGPGIDMTGIVWGNLELESNSPARGAGSPNIPGEKTLGVDGGPCVQSNSSMCQDFITKHLPPKPVPLEEQLNNQENPFEPKNNQTVTINQLKSFPFFLNYLKEATSSSQKKSNTAFNLVIYIILSFIYIMVMHFAVNMGSEFNLWLTTVFFILSGVIGAWIGSYEFAFVIGVILSLIFISGPKKET